MWWRRGIINLEISGEDGLHLLTGGAGGYMM